MPRNLVLFDLEWNIGYQPFIFNYHGVQQTFRGEIIEIGAVKIDEDANDFIFAIQTDSTTQTKKSQWIVAAERVKEHSGSLNASTEDVNFIRASATTKGTTQRTFSINGNRCVGDAFQDFLLSHKIVFGSGSDVVVPYIYFSARTGKGEVGECVLIVTSDVGGSAGAAATFACDAKGIETPEEFDYLNEAQTGSEKAVKA